MTRRKDPEPIQALLDRVLQRLGVARPDAVTELVTDWEEVAGEPFASRSRPVRLDDGCLLLEVADGTAASLLRYRVAELQTRLDDRLGRGLVTDIRLKVARPGNRR